MTNEPKIPDKNGDTSEREWVNRASAWLTAGRSTILLVVLILLYAYIPLSQELQIRGLEYVFIGIIAAMVITVSSNRVRTIIALLFAAVILVLTILTDPEDIQNTQYAVTYYAAIALFVAYAVAAILYEVTQARKFNYNLIVSALAAYLLLALLWAILYTIIEILKPGSFGINPLLIEAETIATIEIFPLILYFSLITLTTVGYGDITPVSPIARSVASIEPIVGQLLLAVLVAWLVGMYIIDTIEDRGKK
ncbi:MAG: hypothetical protein BMS9Abin02_1689 [Anaerolineae bacterium]|nr:MAG: hypothetical protein BMS9Abin02_1689 [Anaerolineae bacterium]